MILTAISWWKLSEVRSKEMNVFPFRAAAGTLINEGGEMNTGFSQCHMLD